MTRFASHRIASRGRLLPRWAVAACIALAGAATGGCDVEADEFAGEDMAEGEADMAEGDEDMVDGDEGDAGDPADDGSDPAADGGDVPPAPDAEPFANDPSAALGGLQGMAYGCYDVEGVFWNLYFDATTFRARHDDGTIFDGTYTTSATAVSLSIPSLGYAETSVEGEIELDHVARIVTPSLDCYAIYTQHDAGGATESARCPSIKYVPGVSWQDNEFVFGEGGDVTRRRWNELSGVDTLYSERFGIYVTLGDRVFMYFAGQEAREDGEQFFSGTLTDQGLYVDQLEPDKGPCA